MEQGPGPFQEQCFGRNRNHGDGDHLLRHRFVDPGTAFGQSRKRERNLGQRVGTYLFIYRPSHPEGTGRALGCK